MGIGHSQSWSVAARADGCYIATEASLSGVVARIWSAKLQQWLQGNLDTWVRLLKLEAEARATGFAGPVLHMRVEPASLRRLTPDPRSSAANVPRA